MTICLDKRTALRGKVLTYMWKRRCGETSITLLVAAPKWKFANSFFRTTVRRPLDVAVNDMGCCVNDFSTDLRATRTSPCIFSLVGGCVFIVGSFSKLLFVEFLVRFTFLPSMETG